MRRSTVMAADNLKKMVERNPNQSGMTENLKKMVDRNTNQAGYLSSLLPAEWQHRLRATFMLNTDDQELIPKGTDLPKRGEMAPKGFRSPSPGALQEVNIPKYDYEIDEDGNVNHDPLYNNQYYVRDTTRNCLDAPIRMVNPALVDTTEIVPSPFANPATSSPGNKNPAVFAYDPTGLRSAMSATNEALEVSIERHQPKHLQTPQWSTDAAAIMAKWERDGTHPVPGRAVRITEPDNFRVFRW